MKKIKYFGQSPSTIILSALIVFFLLSMIINPSKFINASLDGISAWAFNVLPSVLPFMFFTKALSSLKIMPKLVRPLSPITKTLFKTPPISMYAFVMAILSGYPVGSKMVCDLYLQGQITKQDAFKMSAFCSTSGPMFIIGAVGIGMFKNAKIGYILFLSHVFGAILNGILYRKLKVKDEENSNTSGTKNESTNIADIVLNSTLSILSVGCIITIFFIVIECFAPLFNLLPTTLSYFLQGVIEITKGCLSLSTLMDVKLACILASFVVSFGGISTILQSVTMLNSLKMPIKLFVLEKITHGLFAMSLSAILVFLM